MIPQRSPEWHAARLNRVTGSVVGAILGLSPYMTRADVMRSMVRASHQASSEFATNPATEWGAAMEPQALQAFEWETGETVESAPFIPYDDWLGASPDGFVSDNRLIEVKCPYGLRNFPTPVFKTINEQPHYMAQMQIEMLCADLDQCHFWQWTPHGHDHFIVRRNDDWLNATLPSLRQFHAEFLHERDNNADEHLSPRRVTIDTPEAARMVAEWDELSEAEGRAKERKKDLLAAMVVLAGEHNAEFGGRKLTLTRRQGSIAYAAVVKNLCPDADLEPFRGKASESWGLR